MQVACTQLNTVCCAQYRLDLPLSETTSKMSILLDLNLVLLGCGAILLYCMGGAFYRLFLSPLARFPGPKLAAATLWYEFYYDVVKQGQYTFKIKELHERYGLLPPHYPKQRS